MQEGGSELSPWDPQPQTQGLHRYPPVWGWLGGKEESSRHRIRLQGRSEQGEGEEQEQQEEEEGEQ